MGRVTMGCTVKPSMRASGFSSLTRFSICSAARTASCAERNPRRTPPTSDLCEMSLERILTAKAGACCNRPAAMASTSCGEAATRVATVGMP